MLPVVGCCSFSNQFSLIFSSDVIKRRRNDMWLHLEEVSRWRFCSHLSFGRWRYVSVFHVNLPQRLISRGVALVAQLQTYRKLSSADHGKQRSPGCQTDWSCWHWCRRPQASRNDGGSAAGRIDDATCWKGNDITHCFWRYGGQLRTENKLYIICLFSVAASLNVLTHE